LAERNAVQTEQLQVSRQTHRVLLLTLQANEQEHRLDRAERRLTSLTREVAIKRRRARALSVAAVRAERTATVAQTKVNAANVRRSTIITPVSTDA